VNTGMNGFSGEAIVDMILRGEKKAKYSANWKKKKKMFDLTQKVSFQENARDSCNYRQVRPNVLDTNEINLR